MIRCCHVHLVSVKDGRLCGALRESAPQRRRVRRGSAEKKFQFLVLISNNSWIAFLGNRRATKLPRISTKWFEIKRSRLELSQFICGHAGMV